MRPFLARLILLSSALTILTGCTVSEFEAIGAPPDLVWPDPNYASEGRVERFEFSHSGEAVTAFDLVLNDELVASVGISERVFTAVKPLPYGEHRWQVVARQGLMQYPSVIRRFTLVEPPDPLCESWEDPQIDWPSEPIELEFRKIGEIPLLRKTIDRGDDIIYEPTVTYDPTRQHLYMLKNFERTLRIDVSNPDEAIVEDLTPRVGSFEGHATHVEAGAIYDQKRDRLVAILPYRYHGGYYVITTLDLGDTNAVWEVAQYEGSYIGLRTEYALVHDPTRDAAFLYGGWIRSRDAIDPTAILEFSLADLGPPKIITPDPENQPSPREAIQSVYVPCYDGFMVTSGRWREWGGYTYDVGNSWLYGMATREWQRIYSLTEYRDEYDTVKINDHVVVITGGVNHINDFTLNPLYEGPWKALDFSRGKAFHLKTSGFSTEEGIFRLGASIEFDPDRKLIFILGYYLDPTIYVANWPF